MSLKPLLSSVTGRLTEEAHQHVRERAGTFGRWLKAATVGGRVPCPTCHTRLDQAPSWACPECAPYRSRARR